MKDNIYFIPTMSEDLSIYFRQACIFPRKYFPNISLDELETKDEYFFVSTKKDYLDHDCLMEVVLTNEEEKLRISNDLEVFPFFKPIPITRIKKIYFKTEERKDIITTTVGLNSAFFPSIRDFFQIDSNFENTSRPKIDFDKTQNFSDKLKRFDKILGSFAIMKLSGESYMNYSENYFSNLSFFNTVIEEQTKNQQKYNQEKNYFSDKNFLNNLLPYLKKELTEEDIYTSAKYENQVVVKNKFSGQFDFDKLNGITYVLTILYSYGIGDDGKGLKADSLISSNFKSGIKEDYSELIAFCYGYYKGYYAFYKSYSVNGNDRNVKFLLNSKLDYYTIESIYQYVMNSEKNNSTFLYLDNWCPTKPEMRSKVASIYKILDELIFGKKKPQPGTPAYLELYFKNEKVTTTYKNLLENIVSDITNDFQDFINEAREELERSRADFDIERRNFKNEITSKAFEVEQLQLEINKIKSISKMTPKAVNENLKVPEILTEQPNAVSIIDNNQKAILKENERMKILLEKIFHKTKVNKNIKDEIKTIFNP